MIAVVVLVLAYLLGSIPGAYLIAAVNGQELGRLGDGNIGAHNVMRHVGRFAGITALLVDAAKGGLAVIMSRWLDPAAALPVLAGLLAVVGHNYPIWLRFHGGKGLATSLGVALALFPGLAWVTLLAAAGLVALTRNLAFSGVAVACLLVIASAIQGYAPVYVLAPAGLVMLMAIRQLPDLRRMWRDTPDKWDLILNRWIRDRDAKL